MSNGRPKMMKGYEAKVKLPDTYKCVTPLHPHKFTVGNTYTLTMNKEGIGGYTVTNDEGAEIRLNNTMNFRMVFKGGRVNPAPKHIKNGIMTHFKESEL